MMLVIPYPPTMNTYWRNYRGRMVISDKGRDYRAMCCKLLTVHVKTTNARLRVCIYAYVPDRRKRDLDNLFKVTLDSLTHAGIWADDEQIDDLRIIRSGIEKPGRLEIEIEEI